VEELLPSLYRRQPKYPAAAMLKSLMLMDRKLMNIHPCMPALLLMQKCGLSGLNMVDLYTEVCRP
jgi:hypothetical protein